jgi:hypothetical protein
MMNAKIILHATQESAMFLDIGEKDRYSDEIPSLFHFLKTAKRIRHRLVKQIKTPDSTLVTTTQKILRTFKRYYTKKHKEIPVIDESEDKILTYVENQFPEAANAAFVTEITTGELYYATQQSPKNKAPGPDGMSIEFFQAFWEDTKSEILDIVGEMYTRGNIQTQKEHGRLICIPK